jgi:hypothetical protein
LQLLFSAALPDRLRKTEGRGPESDMNKSRILIATAILLTVLLAWFLINRYWFASDLNVTPDAKREIEKAKRR